RSDHPPRQPQGPRQGGGDGRLMPGRLDGKVALITGACSGIGLGTVEVFIAEGAKVVAADLQDAKGATLEQRFGGRLAYVHCDVTAEADIASAVARAAAE